jgi:DNA-binding NarL/FixJ family response regulator
VEHESFVTAGFIQSPWVQAAGILVDGTRVGAVEVYYLRKMPDADEGPFLRDERFLIDTVAGRLGRVCERIAAEEQVRSERTALKNMNLVLREVMVNLEEGKREVKTSIQANVARIIMPLLNDLETALPQGLKGYAALLRNNLEDVTSAFADTLARDCTSLSPTEVRVCKMISQGLSSKEIAQLRCVSTATVARQRESIRRKLGVARSNVNLASYLSNFSGPRAPITSSAARVTKNPDR